jgi:predicted MPP superfamily phosphohydrolase
MVFFIRSLFLQLFLNAYLIYRTGKNRHIHIGFKYLFYSLTGLEVLLYFTGLLGWEYLPGEYFAFIEKANAFWVIFFAYFASLLVFCDLIFYLNRKRFFRVKLGSKGLNTVYITVFVSFFTVTGFHFQTSRVNYLKPQIREFSHRFHSLSSDTVRTKSKYKLLLVSDLHLGYLIDGKVLREYVNLLNAQEADILIINGDLIDYHLEPLKNRHIEDELKRLRATRGVYFVPGNHEYKIDVEACLDWIRGTGIYVLRDSVVTIDSHIQLIGRDDRKNRENRMEWEKLAAQSDPTKTGILITHQPGDIREALPYNFPLILCGHTHHGQIFPVNLSNSLLFHNPYGLQKEGASSWSYTTSGLGLSGFPFRIGSRSEMVIFNIEFY